MPIFANEQDLQNEDVLYAVSRSTLENLIESARSDGTYPALALIDDVAQDHWVEVEGNV